MAGEIVTKKITELEENTTIDDADILMAGDKGTNALKRFTIGAFLTAIKAKLAAWTFDTLQTTSKTLPGAVNELNSNFEGLIIRKTYYSENITVVGGETSIQFDVNQLINTPAGYEFLIYDLNIAGAGWVNITAIQRGNGIFALKNNSSSNQTVNFSIYVSYIKSK